MRFRSIIHRVSSILLNIPTYQRDKGTNPCESSSRLAHPVLPDRRGQAFLRSCPLADSGSEAADVSGDRDNKHCGPRITFML